MGKQQLSRKRSEASMKNAKPEDRSAFLTSFLSFEKMTAIRKKSEKENKTKLMIKQKNISPGNDRNTLPHESSIKDESDVSF